MSTTNKVDRISTRPLRPDKIAGTPEEKQEYGVALVWETENGETSFRIKDNQKRIPEETRDPLVHEETQGSPIHGEIQEQELNNGVISATIKQQNQ